MLGRSMPGALYYGQWVHCIRGDYGNYIPGWRELDTEVGKESRTFRFQVRHHHRVCLYRS